MTKPSHAALVEEVAKKFLAKHGFEFAGDDIFESDNPRAIVAVAFAHDIVATFAARLSDVTPEMVEAVAKAMAADEGWGWRRGVRTDRLTSI